MSGIALCFQVMHGETVDPIMATLWLVVWMFSAFVGVEVVIDAKIYEEEMFEAWLAEQMPPLFEEAHV